MKRSLKLIGFALVLVMLSAGVSEAKFKKIVKPDKSYDFKAVERIVILPMTSKDVEYGKVDAKRLPKVKSILRKTKVTLRKHMVQGMNLSKPSARFYYRAPNRRSTTLLVQSNIGVFDNGNFAQRSIMPWGGKAKVAIQTKFMDGKTKKVVAEVFSSAKAGGSGIVGGGLDSESLYLAAKVADAKIFKYMKKLCDLKYDTMANMDKKVKMGLSDQANVVKEEKKEVRRKGKK